MSIKKQECYLIECDGCGDDFSCDFRPHYDSESSAREAFSENGGGTVNERHYCHECYPLQKSIAEDAVEGRS